MKNAEKKNLIFGFLSKAGLKRVVIALYCIVPLLIFAVGFSAWTIIGHDVTSGGGSFVADGIINSYDYITINTDNFGGINLYPTGFYDKDNDTVTNQANIEVSYTLHIGKCKKLVENSANKTLYADFRLNFVGGEGYEKFYNNLDFAVTVTGGANAITKTNGLTFSGVTFTGAEKKTTSSYTVSLTMDLAEYGLAYTEANLNDEFTLKFVYTVSPKGEAYQTVYNKLVNENLTLMVDVRITDVAPSVGA